MSDQTTYDAEWVGGSASHDLAVLRIEAPAAALRPVTIGRQRPVAGGGRGSMPLATPSV